MSPRADTAAIILAAGAATRMGRNKMLLQLDGVPLVRRAADCAIAAGLSPVIVVVGHEADLVRVALDSLPCAFAVNTEFTGPTSGSLHAGLNALPAAVGAAVVMLADMPWVTPEMLRQLTNAFSRNVAPLAVSRYGEVLAPPLLFRRELFTELLAWHGEGCGKQVVMRHRDEAVFLDWPTAALADLDTPADAQRAGFV